jgi:hypothetical protein
MENVGTKDQLVDIFTKPLDEKRFLQVKEWIEHTWLLKYVLMHPHYMTCHSFEETKVKLVDISFIYC